MLFDWNTIAAPAALLDVQLSAPRTLTGEGLWVCLISSGRCTASLTDASPSPAGSALILPPQSAAAGHLVLSRAPLTLTPEGESHLLCIQLTGQAAVQFLAGLTELPFLARGETCPTAAELLGRLAAEADTPRSRAASQLAFALLCELAGADSAAPPLRRWWRPPLRISARTMLACTAWRSSVSGWGSPRATLSAPLPPPWGCPRGAT